MGILLTLVLALAAVSAPATSLADVAALCRNPADIEETKSALLKAGWRPITAERQAEHDKWISEIDPSEDSKTTDLVFEQGGDANYSISVSHRVNTDGSWFRGCGLNDATNRMRLNLEEFKHAFGLENADTARIGLAYYWQNSETKRTYMLVLPTPRKNESVLVIGTYGED